MLNYREYSPDLVGTLVFGLNDNSRVKKHFSGQKLSLEMTLRARMADELAFLAWAHTEDARRNKNRPKSILQALLGTEKKEEYDTFNTFEEFEEKWNAI